MDIRPAKHSAAASITLTDSQIQILSGMLTELDEFLRHHPGVLDALSDFLAARGHSHPRFRAANLIDQVSFTAAGMREVAAEDDSEP